MNDLVALLTSVLCSLNLGSTSFETRQSAKQCLNAIGTRAIPALALSSYSQDPEVRKQAKRLLGKRILYLENQTEAARSASEHGLCCLLSEPLAWWCFHGPDEYTEKKTRRFLNDSGLTCLVLDSIPDSFILKLVDIARRDQLLRGEITHFECMRDRDRVLKNWERWCWINVVRWRSIGEEIPASE